MYQAPIDDIAFTLRHIVGLDRAMAEGRAGDLSDDLLDAILAEAARFAEGEIAPLAAGGDREGARFADGRVTMPAGWKALYHAWRDGGWNGLSAPVDHGGQGLPLSLAVAASEMWNGASMAFGIGPTLTMGAIEALEAHGSDELKDRYLSKLVSGEWMGTMNLTEPQAGSDLSTLRTRAERSGDGTYRIFGQKIYITYGEHDLTENIVHLVLARLPDAPEGVKGISLFLVPKFLPGEDGALGARNDAFCHAIEHKLGIHASPTCTMIFGDGRGDSGEPGAVGWLVGEENRGLACMFTMMNSARLFVGTQGLGVAEAAYGKALAYARERRQGRSTLLARDRAEPASRDMSPIIEHPDVARTLLTMKALVGAARAIAYSCGHALDQAAQATSEDEARFWRERANLLTPLAKSFPTDVGVDVASMGIQIHGGMGYVEETGAARLLRDARIAPIYEGTNGIQAIDLVTRKLPQSGGEAVRAYLSELRDIASDAGGRNEPGFAALAQRLNESLSDLTEATDQLLVWLGEGRTGDALAYATPYQRLFSLVAGNCYLAKGALAETEGTARLSLARFMADTLLSETGGLKRQVLTGVEGLNAAREAL
ncbi:acyl-CoA dehydrogenase [Aureimonas ureilytica]|uniref:acyl-CoA dehydrogenase n=1 Tax=Aureimonas ureilytica TaxID=401562 RepID=UPI000361F769|nr:acyl-CoA dehydrogenase [Aureimonas ureilytica]